MPTEVFFYGIAYLLYLVLQSWVIVGIYLSAEGSTEVLPDGSHRDSEMILYPAYKFLHQTMKRDRIYLGEQLDDLLRQLRKAGLWNEVEGETVTTVWGRTRFHEEVAYDAFVKSIPLIQQQYGIDVAHTGADCYVIFFKTYNEFRFSKYVRKPLLGCVRCMASFWSIFTYALPCWYLFGIDRTCIAMWIPTVFALVFLNSFFYRKQK